MPEELASVFVRSLVRAEIAVEVIDAPEEVGLALLQLAPLVNRVLKVTEEDVLLEQEAMELSVEFGKLIVILEKAHRDLRIRDVELT
ncbi:MAG: hypothetical protein IIC24_11935 [Chloroflexi bacterium]|nr:hypothetical protein [Chloroflexota bacterium]